MADFQHHRGGERVADRIDHAFEELSADASLLDLLLEQSGVGIIIADAKGNITAFNPEAEAQHGKGFMSLPANECIDTYGLCRLDGTKVTLEELALFRALQGERHNPFSYLVRHPDGTTRVISGHANPLRLANGQLAGAVVVSRDETDSYWAEQRSRAARQDLERSERLTRRLLDNSHDVLLFVDMRGRVLWQNPRAAEFLGMASAKQLETALFAQLWAEDSQQLAALHFGQVVRGTQTTFIGQTRADGAQEPRWWSVNLTLDADLSDGRPGIFASLRDITQLKRVEAEVREQARFAQQLIGIVSHDLRNPISAILLSAGQLARHLKGDLRQSRSIERVAWAAQRANRLIYDLLDFTQSRLGGGLEVKLASCDIAQLARRTIEEIALQNPQRQIDLQVQGDVAADVDADRVAQIFINLINNAIQHGPPEAPIRVTLSGDDGDVTLAINNPGPVIPPSTLDQLFEPMQRAKATASKTRSIGLGLYIVKCIAEAHAGRVSAQSSAERGNTFVAHLPRRCPDDDGRTRAGH